MLLVANLANTYWYKKPKKWPWQMGTHLRELSKSFRMNTYMTGFSWFQNFLHFFLPWTKVVSALKGLSIDGFKPNYCKSMFQKEKQLKEKHQSEYYRWTWIWRTTVRRIFAYDGWYAWSQSDAYQVFVICIWRILHMTDQFSWSHWVRHIQVHLYQQNSFR